MLRGARERASSVGTGQVEFIHGDIRTLRLGRTFDAAICMFAVLGYQTSDADVAAALDTVRTHLRPGGWFAFDVWYGPAVEATGPTTRVKVVAAGDGEIERHATAVLEPERQLCTVSYRLYRRAPGLQDDVVEETHRMRYFFPDELATSLTGAGLRLESLAAFPDASAPASEESWNVIATATR
jgi:SAM-dependent methyltransferase